MEPRTSTLWFSSKIDWWLGVLLAVSPAVALLAAMSAPESERSEALLGLVVLAVVYVGLVFPMRYGITDSHLIVRHGFVKKRIELASIRSVTPTRSPLSSPALSLDRLRVTFGTGLFKRLLISPADKRRFLVELALRARLLRDGDGLTRP
jgi:hypothetical protein